MLNLLRATFRLVLASLLLAALSGPVLAEGSLRGSAKDAEGNPVQGVEIKLVPSDTSLITLTATSNKKGKFAIGLIRRSPYILVAKKEGMRVDRIDANVAEPEDDSYWDFHDDIAAGTKPPQFPMTGVSRATYDIRFVEHDGDLGEYGTGLPVSPTKVIVGLIEEGKMQEAVETIEKNLEKAPDSVTYNYLLGFVLSAQERHDEALVAVGKALETDPTFEGANLLKARILERKGDVEASVEFYQLEADVALSVEVTTDALLGLAMAYEKLERFPEAVTALESLIEVVPEHVGAYKELAALHIRLGNEDKAREMMDQVLALGAEDPDILYNLGAERFNASDFEAAADYFSQAIQAAPDYKDAYLRLAYTKLNLGDREGAVENLEKFLELSPEDDPEAQSARAILQQLKK